MRMTILKIALLGFWLGLTAPLKADIPFFWLDKPQGRSNPNDPNSPLFKASTPVPVGTDTPTPSRTASTTHSLTLSSTPSNTPANTATATPTPAVDGWDPSDDTSGGATSVATNSSSNAHWIGSGPDGYDYFAVTFVDTMSYEIRADVTSGSGTITLQNMGTSGGSVLGTVNHASAAVFNLTSSGINGTVYFRVSANAAMQYNFTFNDVTGATPTYTVTLTATPTLVPDTFTSTATPTTPPTSTETPSMTASPTFTPGACAVACAGCIKYEDFELPLIGPYAYQDTGSAAPVTSTTMAEFHSCAGSLQVDLATGTGNFAAAGFGSNFYVADVIDASGTYYLNVWVKAATAISFRVSFSEYRGVGDPLDEGWTSPAQSHTGGGTWQEFHIELASFTENIYNGACAPNCLTLSNNTIDKNLIGAIDINFTQTGYTGTVYVDDLSFDPTMPTNTPTPSAPPVAFNDFEDAAACGSYSYQDAASTFSQAADASAAYNGSVAGWLLTIDTDDPGFVWGAGGGTQGTGCGIIDATGRNNLTFWMRATKNAGAASSVNFVITLAETNVPVSWPAVDPNNETWGSPPQSVSTFGTWQKISIPLGGFTEKMNNGACDPNCATTGNGVLDKLVMSGFDFNITNAGFEGTVDIDDIMFE